MAQAKKTSTPNSTKAHKVNKSYKDMHHYHRRDTVVSQSSSFSNNKSLLRDEN
jgi:hypothetical protein